MVDETRVMRRGAVMEVTGLCKSTLYDLMAEGNFPRPIPLSPSGRVVGWRADEVAKWVEARTAARDGKAA